MSAPLRGPDFEAQLEARRAESARHARLARKAGPRGKAAWYGAGDGVDQGYREFCRRRGIPEASGW